MKLDEMHRREFMKKTGGGMASLLISKGLGPATAERVAGLAAAPAGRPVAILRASASGDGPIGFMDAVVGAAQGLAKLVPGAKPRNLSDDGDGETFDFGVALDSDSIARLLKTPGANVVDRGGGGVIEFELGIDGGSYTIFGEEGALRDFRAARPVGDVVKAVWDTILGWSEPEEYARMGWLRDVPDLIKRAKRHGLRPPAGVGSWADFPRALRAGVKDLRRETDAFRRKAGKHKYADDNDDYGEFDDRRGPEARTDLAAGMHQDFDHMECLTVGYRRLLREAGR